METLSVTQKARRTRVGNFQVAELARQAGVTAATVRYYVRVGLLDPDRDRYNGYRRFSHEDLRRLTFVRKAQALGLTISDIRLILDRLDHHDPVCELVVDIVERRLEEIRVQCDELAALKARMEAALEQWVREPAGETDADFCPLIEEVDARCGMAEPMQHARGREPGLRVVPQAGS